MADININAQLGANNGHFSKSDPPQTISFHAARACTVTFSPATGNCFGNVGSLTFPPYDQSPQVQSTTNTGFNVGGSLPADTYDITFSSPMPRPKARTKPAVKKTAAKKAAPKKASTKKGSMKKVSTKKSAQARKSAKAKKKKR